MNISGLVTIKPNQEQLLRDVAVMMGTSFLEENWFITWLSALDALETTKQRKEELMHAVFLDDLEVHAPFEGVYALPDLTAATGAYRFSELKGTTHSELEEQTGKHLTEVATDEELRLLDEQARKMEPISQFDWARHLEKGNDHIYFYADDHGLNCYLECYADKLQHMYEHLGFELIDELYAPGFEVYERRMVRRARIL